jgi:hypothetical protein
VPIGAPDSVQVEVLIDAFHYQLGTDEEAVIPGRRGSAQAMLTDTPYDGQLLSINPQSSFGGEDIVISGEAVDRGTGALVANAPLKVVLRVGGFERSFQVFTDADGRFDFTYTPGSGEAGIYTVSVLHPDRLDRPAQGQFTINSIVVSPTQYSVRAPKNYQSQLDVRLQAGDGTEAQQVRIEYRAEDQPLGVLPSGITMQLPAAVDLGSGEAKTLTVGFSSDDTADNAGSLVLRVMSNTTGPAPIATILVGYEFSEARAAVFATPSLLEIGTTYDTAVSDSITLENRGLAPLTSMRMEFLEQGGSAPAPSWIYLTTPSELSMLDAGATFQVELTANPPSTEFEGYHQFILRVTGDNYPPYDIPVVVAVLQNGIGSVLFHASDMYTATLDVNGDPIPGLAGARIKIQHENVLTVEREGITDASGELFFEDLPTGRYLYRASVPNHQDVAGRFAIQPGITTAQEIFLLNSVITIEWSVKQISLEDRYEIVLTATFQTNVPVPVVVIEPVSIPLPTLRKGEVFYGEFAITNYGLIRAENVTPQLPTSDEFMRYEFLRDIPKTIEAKERIVVPYRVTALRSLDPSADTPATGGGNCSYQVPFCFPYEAHCANGQLVVSAACGYFVNSFLCGGTGPSGPGVLWAPGTTGSGGGRSSPGASTSTGQTFDIGKWLCAPLGKCPSADQAPPGAPGVVFDLNWAGGAGAGGSR